MSEPETEQPKPEEAADAAEPDTGSKDSAPASPKSDDTGPATSDRAAEVINNFYGQLNAGGAIFGIGMTNRTGRKPETGRLDPTDIAEVRTWFTAPEPYADTLESLRTNHVVVLVGRPGIGKRSAAISLLRDMTDQNLVALTPTASLDDLASRDYRRDCGYLLTDHLYDTPSEEVDFAWRTVRDRVRDAGAYLVVTRTATVAVESVRHVPWSRPEAEQALVVLLGAVPSVEVLGVLPADYTMADLTTFARRIATGETATTAASIFDVASAATVRSWFEENRTSAEVLDVAALAFLTGASERTFETALARLTAAFEAHGPQSLTEDDDSNDRPAPSLPQRRRKRSTGNDLIRTELVSSRLATSHVLVFAKPEYQSLVIAELWANYDVSVLDAIVGWINELVGEQLNLDVAAGVALLAEIVADEVGDQFLDPWSRGVLGWTGQATAACVLWMMCYRGHASTALRIATQWATQGDVTQRRTAALTFSGELGVRYPTEAIRRLWNLARQSGDGHDRYSWLASLFATLVAEARGAVLVLRTLARTIERSAAPGTPLDHRAQALRATLTVLRMEDATTGHPAVFRLVRDRPEHADVVGQLWAAVLRYRPLRREALTALWDGLSGLTHRSSAQAEVKVLGQALVEALPTDELIPLRRDLSTIQAAAGRSGSDQLLADVLTALNLLHGQRENKERHE